MAKRYFFWRDATGRPVKKGEPDQHALNHSLNLASEVSKLNSQGEIVWRGSPLFSPLESIENASAILAPDGRELNTIDHKRIVTQSMAEMLKNNGSGSKVNSSEFRKYVDKNAAAFFRTDKTAYDVVTTLSTRNLHVRNFSIENCVLSIYDGRPSGYGLPDSIHFRLNEQIHVKHAKGTKYQHVKVRVVEHTTNSAISNALIAVDLFRAILSFFCTYSSRRRRFGLDVKKPVGVIQFGSIHTLHTQDGKLVDDKWWFQTDYFQDLDCHEPKKGWTNAIRFLNKSMRMIDKLAYRSDLLDLFSRYIQALDSINNEAAFLHLWSMLEKITDSVGSDYDKLVRRASWIYDDHDLVRDDLESLRRVRNNLVHRAFALPDQQWTVYVLKTLVDHHMLRLLNNEFRISSIKEYAAIMDNSRKIERLLSKRESITKVIRILRKWDKGIANKEAKS